MADPNTPDVQKLLSSFDPTKIMGEVQNLLQQYKLPGLDMEALAATQKKNIEALTTANRTAVEGLQALARRQTEVLQHDRGFITAHRSDGGRPVRHGDHLVFVEAPLELLLQPRVVLHDQQRRLVVSHSSLDRPRRMLPILECHRIGLVSLDDTRR